MSVGLAIDQMAKSKAKPKKPTEPEPSPMDRKPMVLQMRGSAEWKEWAEEVAAHDGVSLAALADRAIRRYAKEIGITKPPPRR